MSKICPKCGADQERDPDWATAFKCGSHLDARPGAIMESGVICETPQCLRAQLALIEKQRDVLLAACRAIEFLPPAEGNILSYCPDCGYPHDVGHSDLCDFGNAIAAAATPPAEYTDGLLAIVSKIIAKGVCIRKV